MSHHRAHYLSDVPKEQIFYLHNGVALKNLPELREFLTGADETIYNYHVTSEKNDFRNWISDAVKDRELASQLENGMTKEMMQEIVDARINSLEHHNKEQTQKEHDAPIEIIKEPMDEKIDQVLEELDTPIEPVPHMDHSEEKCGGNRFGYFMTGVAIGLGIGILSTYVLLKLLPNL